MPGTFFPPKPGDGKIIIPGILFQFGGLAIAVSGLNPRQPFLIYLGIFTGFTGLQMTYFFWAIRELFLDPPNSPDAPSQTKRKFGPAAYLGTCFLELLGPYLIHKGIDWGSTEWTVVGMILLSAGVLAFLWVSIFFKLGSTYH